MSKRDLKESGDNLFFTINTIWLVGALLVVLYPLIYVVSASFSSPIAVTSGRVWLWPVDFSLEGYKAVFRHRDILSGFGNSFFYTFFGTIINIVLTVMAAYPMSRKEFKARNFYMFLFAFTMFFNGGLIPTYILMGKLQLIDTRGALLLIAGISVYNMIITRTFFQTSISDELIEAARVDGMNDIQILIKIVLPLSKAIIAVITLFYAVTHWNVFFNAFIYLNTKSKYPLQLILRQILVMNQVDFSEMSGDDIERLMKMEGLAELLKYSLIIVASVPVLLLYPLVQKYFVKGVMIGALKG